MVDHKPLVDFMRTNDPKGRVSRWIWATTEYQFKLVYKKGAEHHRPDALSRLGTRVPMMNVLQAEGQQVEEDASAEGSNRGVQEHVLRYLEKLQKEDATLRDMVNFLATGELPDQKARRLKITQRKGEYMVEEGVLFHRGDGGRRIVIPERAVPHVIRLFHASPFAGHLGVEKTVSRIQEFGYFPNMRTQVNNFINQCEMCSLMRAT